MSRGWLIVFAKAPRPGLVKTRLSPPLSLDECAELYEAMLGDVLETSLRCAQQLDLEPVLAYHPPDGAAEMISRTPAGYRLQLQHGSGLARRMANAFAEAFASGVDRVVLRGSDSPALEIALVEEAIAGLDAGDDLVLTPDQSGGYAMIAMRSPHAPLFDVAMSTGEVLDETLNVARSLSLRSSITAPTIDIDTDTDLRAFETLMTERSLDLCPRTVESISALARRAVL